jgi:preprotein translocase subunit YajC
MNNLIYVAATGAESPIGLGFSVIWILVMGLAFYFLAIRPQKKQQRQLEALISTVEAGDSVLTTSGFYGVVIDVMEDVIIVEFGNNKNCRIPMKKTAVVEVEKPGSTDKAL